MNVLLGDERKKSQTSGSHNFPGQQSLMLGTTAGYSSGKDFTSIGSKSSQGLCIFVIQFEIVSTNLTYFFLEISSFSPSESTAGVGSA